MDLSAIRRFAGLTQTALAARMGIEQTRVSAVERQTDWKLSTLIDYLLGTGLEAHLWVSKGDCEHDLTDVLAFELSPETRRFKAIQRVVNP
jgi:transcriptional regulator with XRE-family HTH domain